MRGSHQRIKVASVLGLISACTLGAILLVSGQGAGQAAPAATSVTGTLEQQADQIANLLECQARYPAYDDLYNFAVMRGVSCLTAEGEIVVARVYETRREADIALTDWPLASVDRYLVRGDGWFAVGPIEPVTKLALKVTSSSEVTQKSVSEVTQSAEEQARTSCVRLLTNALIDLIAEPPRYQSERADFAAIYPGLPELLEQNVDETQRHIARESATNELEFESVVSKLQSPLKGFCATAPSR